VFSQKNLLRVNFPLLLSASVSVAIIDPVEREKLLANADNQSIGP
jgi:hypothetical protein